MKTLTATLILVLFSLFIVPSFQQDYDPSMAFEMLRASSAAYCSDSDLEDMDCGDICDDLYSYTFEKQYSYTISSEESISFSTFVNDGQKIHITSFRGTHGDDQLADEVIHVSATSYLLQDVNNAVVSGYFYNRYVNNIRSDFLYEIQQAVLNYPDYDFYMVGHSLGGALATIASLDAVLEGITESDNTHLYTYGSPRVGDYNFAQAVVDNVDQIFRVTHHKDAIPHIPPCRVGWNLECVSDSDHSDENGTLLFHAWHVWPEVYYSTDTQSGYKICQGGEDPTCADQFSMLVVDVADHLLYLGVSTKCGNS